MKPYSLPVEEALERIRDRQVTIAIVGQGYIGFTESVVLADAGFRIIGYDVVKKLVENINAGAKPHVYEPGLEEIYRRVLGKTYRATDNPEELREADVIGVSVGTPVDKDVSFKYIDSAAETIGKNLQAGQLVFLRSTIPPGTTAERFLPLLEKHSGLKAGKDFGLAFSPEKTREGVAVEDLRRQLKIAGGIDRKSGLLAAEILKAFGAEANAVSSPLVAELSKLVDNNYIQLSVAAQEMMARLCSEYGVDYMELWQTLDYYRRGNYKPGPGIGGSCLPKDSQMLVAQLEKTGRAETARFFNDIKRADREYKEWLIKDFMEKAGKANGAKRIGVLGIAFKADTNDTRESPCPFFIEELKKAGFEVKAFDPHVRTEDSLEDVLGCEAILFLTDHKEFKNIVEKLPKAKNGFFYDARMSFAGQESRFREKGWKFGGIGRPVFG